MTMTTTNQAYIFLATVYGGMLLGIVYDVYRAFRMIIKPGRWFVAVLDLSFWILAVLLSFFMLFKVNGGEIRLFTFIGLGMGWGLYSLIIGGMLVKLLVKVYEIITGIILWPFRTILKAFRWLIRKFRKKDSEDS
ncbi:MAG TPA: spore cortex biosynthesis protein YabQ [Clostridia bacterium]|nr:spore cortex biosynthesis protein YabQ [Clostridia bacterium]